MKGISLGIKQRFCKDNNVSIQLFDEPYFEERLRLLGFWDKWSQFLDMYEKHFDCNEEAYFEYYNQLKEKIIQYIKDSETFQLLNCDQTIMLHTDKDYQFKQSDVYKIPNIGKHFISIDMKKANFSALVYYGKLMNKQFFQSYNWNLFMKQFTDLEYFYSSKYIRQVVFGNCNPKRQILLEKSIMISLIKYLENFKYIELSDVYSVCSDEVIINVEGFSKKQLECIYSCVDAFSKIYVPLEFEYFKLGKILNTDGFIKKILDFDNNTKDIKPKCLSPYEIPFVYKKLQGLPLSDTDMYFMHDGRLAKYIKSTNIEFCYDSKQCMSVKNRNT